MNATTSGGGGGRRFMRTIVRSVQTETVSEHLRRSFISDYTNLIIVRVDIQRDNPNDKHEYICY